MTERVQYNDHKFIPQHEILLRKKDNRFVKSDGGVRNIAITFLTLESGDLNSPADDYDAQVDDDIRHKSKFLHEFRVRRKHPFTKKASPSFQRNDTCLELGLMGKGYLNDKNDKSDDKPTPRTGKSKENNQPMVSPNPSDTSNVSRGAMLGLPTVSSRPTKSDLLTLSNIHQFSYLSSDFGFGKYRTDTFTGLGLHSRRHLFSGVEVQNRLATQAKRHIDACTTVGMVGKRSRAAQNVLGLKRTIEEGVVFDKNGKLVPLIINMGKRHQEETHKLKSSLRGSIDKTNKNGDQTLPSIYGNSSFSNTE